MFEKVCLSIFSSALYSLWIHACDVKVNVLGFRLFSSVFVCFHLFSFVFVSTRGKFVEDI